MALVRSALRPALICCCFALSGAAALIYQTAWTRQFALVFGTSELAVATVLAAYMAGLGLGAASAGRWLSHARWPVRLYAILELCIGMSAWLLVPWCLRTAEFLLVATLGGQASPPMIGGAGSTLFYLGTAFLTLLVPTTLMGAALPLLVRDAVHDEAQIGTRIGALYACNTGGAVTGAVLAALLLLPQWGLRATIAVAAGVNLLVFLLAAGLWLLDTRLQAQPDATAVIPALPGEWQAAKRYPWILPLMLLSGAVAFMQEVLWTRLLQRVVGSSIQSFGIMVASFLAGIALGGVLGSHLARRRALAASAFAGSQIAVALALLLAWYGLLSWGSAPQSQAARALFGFGLLLPLSLAIGVSYPLAVRVLATGVADAALASARVYGWNTTGAILGALGGGYWLIPQLRYEGTVRLSVTLSVLLALVASLTILRFHRWRVLVLATALLATLAFRPAAPDSLLRLSPLRPATGELLYYAVGRSTDVVVLRNDSSLDLRTNGLPEAGTPLRGAAPGANVEAWMPALAVLARPQSSSLLIVGFGSGNVVNAVPPSVRQIDVIELEPRVIAANRFTAALRQAQPLADPRLTVVLNDARAALALTGKRYDVIVSQPSHPWTAGASHLYTREFMQQAHQHLTPGGVFVQWMGAEYIDATLLHSLARTLLDVYREVRVYRPSNTTLLFLASDGPLDLEHHPAALRAVLAQTPEHYARLGLNAPEDLLAALAVESDGVRVLAADSQPITDDTNRLATANVYARGLGLTSEQTATLLSPYDPLRDPDSFVYRSIAPEISFDYLWRRVNRWRGAGATSRARFGQPTEPQLEPAIMTAVAQAGARQDWSFVAAADATLANVPWTAPWAIEAARWRVEWRIRMGSGATRRRQGAAAIAIADRVVVSQPDANWQALRAWSGVAADQPEVTVESAAAFCAAIDGGSDRVAADLRPALRDQAVALLAAVRQLDDDKRVDGERRRIVLRRLTRLAGLP